MTKIVKNILIWDQWSQMCADKKCQATKCYKETSDMQLVKPQMDMWLPKPAVLYQYRRLSKDRDCQATICEYDDFESQSTVRMCFEKECQENTNMWPVMPDVNMQLSKPAITRLCSDKNCQSTRCYKKKNYEKYCQSDM